MLLMLVCRTPVCGEARRPDLKREGGDRTESNLTDGELGDIHGARGAEPRAAAVSLRLGVQMPARRPGLPQGCASRVERRAVRIGTLFAGAHRTIHPIRAALSLSRRLLRPLRQRA